MKERRSDKSRHKPEQLFLLFHEHELPQDAVDTKIIGVFSSKAKARQAVDFLKSKPGFCKAKRGFQIGVVVVDEVGWKEGYFTYRY